MQRFKWTAIAVAVGVMGCGSAPDSRRVEVASGTVIRNVTVVDTRTGQTARAQSVVFDKGTIQQVLPDAAVTVGGGVRVVDGSVCVCMSR